METDETAAKPAAEPAVSSNEEAAKEAHKLAKKIINDTAKLDPNRIPQDTGRSRRKVCVCFMTLLNMELCSLWSCALYGVVLFMNQMFLNCLGVFLYCTLAELHICNCV